jgi:hypothetical protein
MTLIKSATPSRTTASAWNNVVKHTIGRFVRGNIAAQNNRVLLKEEQQKRHERARKTAINWRSRTAG